MTASTPFQTKNLDIASKGHVFLVLWQARCFSVPGKRGKEYELGSHYRVASHWVFLICLSFFGFSFLALSYFEMSNINPCKLSALQTTALRTVHLRPRIEEQVHSGTNTGEHAIMNTTKSTYASFERLVMENSRSLIFSQFPELSVMENLQSLIL